jgi:DNA-directed RNA polymerase I, II, and III subunit RPABC2
MILVEDYKDIIAKYDPTKNITKNILSKYEKTKLLGMRMEQLARSADPYVKIDPTKHFDPLHIAEQELMERKLPFMLCRKLPNGKTEYWRLEDMIIF